MSKALDILAALGEVKMNVEVLQKTKVGLTVNKLRKASDKEVGRKAKTLLKTWKTLLSSGGAASSSSAPPPSGSAAGGGGAKKTGKGVTLDVSSPARKEAEGKTSAPTTPRVEVEFEPTGVRIRDAFRKQFCRGLAEFHMEEMAKSVAQVAEEIESVLLAAFEGNHEDPDYKARGRALSAVLRDLQNPLPFRLLTANISADEFIALKDEDLVSPELQQIIKEARVQGKKDMVVATDEAETDMFQCSRCKKRQTTFFQLQTRSADEPMTVFIKCIPCGKRWRN